jgi:Gluconate 2-dehydrogenase subunit 3
MSVPFDRRTILRGLGVSAFSAATSSRAWAKVLMSSGHEHAADTPVSGASAWTPKVLSAHQDETLIALSEAIIPQTETAGAKAALVNRFIDAMLEDADPTRRAVFLRGFDWLDARCRELFGGDFVSSTPEQQTALLTILSSPSNRTSADQLGVEFFRTVKSWTITGYYTSEIGLRDELNDDGQMFFAEYKGCVHPEHGAAPTKRG